MPTESVIPISSAKKEIVFRLTVTDTDIWFKTREMQQADLGKQMVQLQKDIKQMSKVKMMTMRVVVMVMVMMDISSKIHLVHMITTMIMTNKSFSKTSKEHKPDCVTTA